MVATPCTSTNRCVVIGHEATLQMHYWQLMLFMLRVVSIPLTERESDWVLVGVQGPSSEVIALVPILLLPATTTMCVAYSS